MRIDSHQHFWRYDPKAQVWMTEAMGVLRRDYLPAELQPLLRTTAFDATVAVQARQSVEETAWLLDLADEHDFIRGVVGWVDLRSPRVARQLEQYAARPKFVGVRHVVHDEPEDDFLLLPEFRRGLRELRRFGLTYDLLLYPRHLRYATQLVAELPEQPFVLDHLAKPSIKERQLSPWQEDLRALARFPQVHCKLSGMVTETVWHQWRAEDFHRYLDIAFEAFGPERLMIGSDWPVCTLSGTYAAVMQIVTDYLQPFASEIRAGILGGNCARFYQLNKKERPK